MMEPTKKEATLWFEMGTRLMEARIAADMDRAELAQLSGISESEIESWELGSVPLYPAEIDKLCHILDVTPDYIFGWRDLDS